MRERPIIFSSEMVRALLDGRKTMTRRVLKNTTEHKGPYSDAYIEAHKNSDGWKAICPYGQIGDRIWVRESFVPPHKTINPDVMTPLCYRATNPYPEMLKWKSPLFMERKYSRIILEIKNIRVERLQDITEEDSLKEGAIFWWNNLPQDEKEEIYSGGYGPIEAFKLLWESIKGEGSWKLNPWVWVIEFKRV